MSEPEDGRKLFAWWLRHPLGEEHTVGNWRALEASQYKPYNLEPRAHGSPRRQLAFRIRRLRHQSGYRLHVVRPGVSWTWEDGKYKALWFLGTEEDLTE